MNSQKDMLTPWYSREGMALVTDLYQLTMAAGYIKNGMNETTAAFEYFFRELPPNSGFAVFAGLEQMLSGVANMRFTDSDIEYLRKAVGFEEEVLEHFRDFRADLDIWAAPEGSVVFPNEPLVRVEGPLIAGQLVETFLLNALNYPTLIATKAARVCLAAEGDPVLEFGLRRAHGPDGGLTGSRAAYIGGCAGTSNVLAGKVYGIPVKGTHAHSWVMSHESELAAFRNYARTFPDASILLVDTYNTLESGVPNAITAFKELRQSNPGVRAAIRLDSGDLARLSKGAYKQLKDAGFDDPMIVASNDLDEDLIADLKRQGAKINAWGVGTHLITSRDHPALGGVYKVVSVKNGGKWEPRFKLASNPEKTTDPGRKQVSRLRDGSGHPVADVLCRADDGVKQPGLVAAVDRERLMIEKAYASASTEPLLLKVMERGKLTSEMPDLKSIRERADKEISLLPEEMKRLRNPERYPVMLCPELARMKDRMLRQMQFAETEDKV